MQDYRVELDTFSGPLDLLLFLVRRDEIDLRDIPIARLTEQYLEWLKKLEQIDVNLAGEFLVMAATLLEIKSTMLLPAAPAAPDGATEGDAASAGSQSVESLDPRLELVQQLLAYKRFKDTAMDLERRLADWQQRYPRKPFVPKPRDIVAEQIAAIENLDAPPGTPGSAPGAAAEDLVDDSMDESAGLIEFDLEDANVLDLAEAFARIMEFIGKSPYGHQVTYDDTPIGLHAEDILDRLGREGGLSLQKIFEGRARSERIGLFLALLELTRQRKIRVRQDELAGPIEIDLREEEDAAGEAAPDGPGLEQSRWIDPATGKMQYDWPDEESRRAAEHRAKFRMKWLEKKKAEQTQASPDAEAEASTQEPTSLEAGDTPVELPDADDANDPAAPADDGDDKPMT